MSSQSMDAKVLEVQKICCVNNGGFVMDFKVQNEEDQNVTERTPAYPIAQSKTVDLADHGLNKGAIVFPFVNVVAGSDLRGPRVRYAPNGHVATYIVTGTTLINHIELVS